jgi:hypothetical protein
LLQTTPLDFPESSILFPQIDEALLPLEHLSQKSYVLIQQLSPRHNVTGVALHKRLPPSRNCETAKGDGPREHRLQHP